MRFVSYLKLKDHGIFFDKLLYHCCLKKTQMIIVDCHELSFKFCKKKKIKTGIDIKHPLFILLDHYDIQNKNDYKISMYAADKNINIMYYINLLFIIISRPYYKKNMSKLIEIP
jgi:hypothetical protein